jgi:putative tricarboxylic transport membrane protein
MPATVGARRGEAGAGLVLAAIGAGLAALSWPLPVGEVGNPGAGFAPLALGLALVLLGLACALRGWRQAEGAAIVLGEPKALICLGALFAAALLWRPAGFLVAGGLLLTVLFAALARLRWWKAVLAALASALVARLVFERLLGVALPAGLLPF